MGALIDEINYKEFINLNVSINPSEDLILILLLLMKDLTLDPFSLDIFRRLDLLTFSGRGVLPSTLK